MGFRAPLDLTEFIRALPVQATPGELDEAPIDERLIAPELTRVGYGPLVASSCTDLAIDPVLCWDANNYHRALGVHWKATRSQLRKAFMEADGHASDWLTYVMTQLLDPQVRRAYDRTPLGEPFLGDRYVQAEIKARAKAEVARRAEQGQQATEEEVLEEEGFLLDAEDYQSEGQEPWLWSYYNRQTACYDTDRLQHWQSMIISALARDGIVLGFAVGFAKTDDPGYFARREDAGTLVAYLGHTTEPDPVIAERTSTQLAEMSKDRGRTT